jgi:hypothetical protein
MEHIRRDARLIEIERKIRLYELRRLIARHSGEKKSFPLVSEWKHEQLDLLERF